MVIFSRNELRQFLLRELCQAEPLTSCDLAERLYYDEGKDVREHRINIDVARRVSKAVRLLQGRKVVRGTKGGSGAMCGRLATETETVRWISGSKPPAISTKKRHAQTGVAVLGRCGLS